MRLAVHWIDDVNPMDRWRPLSFRATGVGLEEAIAVVAVRRSRAIGKSRAQKTKNKAALFAIFCAYQSSNSYIDHGTKSCSSCRIYGAPARRLGLSGPPRTKTSQPCGTHLHRKPQIIVPPMYLDRMTYIQSTIRLRMGVFFLPLYV